MANVTVPAGAWVEVFNRSTNGSFRLVRMKAKLFRGASLPADDSVGLTIDCDESRASEVFTYVSDGTNNLYVLNKSAGVGLVEKDI